MIMQLPFNNVQMNSNVESWLTSFKSIIYTAISLFEHEGERRIKHTLHWEI